MVCFGKQGAIRVKICVASLCSLASLACRCGCLSLFAFKLGLQIWTLCMGSRGQLELNMVIAQTSSVKLGLQIGGFALLAFKHGL